MNTTIEATFDGEVFRPCQPVSLEPNTTVRLTIEQPLPKLGEPYSFLKYAMTLNLEGPPDWSANVDKYLYGNLHEEEEEDSAG
jgi:predicted DNA-binding antitoxin AbrB/MazE fold protein